MKLLLDTHALLWLDSDSSRLSSDVRTLITDVNNEILVSVASLWEIRIKEMLGRITLRTSLSQIVEDQVAANSLIVLDITPEHVYDLENLPAHHRDPFDRIIICVARIVGATLLSRVSVFQNYPIDVRW